MTKWSESLRLGVPVLDRDHRQLLDAVSGLEHLFTVYDGGDADRATADAASEPFLQKILDEVVKYTRTHFAREEMLMRLAGYPDYAAHRRLHEGLARRADRLEMDAHRHRLTADDLRVKLGDRLVAHILHEDVKIKPWVEKLEEAA